MISDRSVRCEGVGIDIQRRRLVVVVVVVVVVVDDGWMNALLMDRYGGWREG